jgi:hypothetical protein
MPYLPILFLHVSAGTFGLLSGTAAMFFRKGSPRHVQAGKVFVVSTLIMAVGAVYLGIVKNQPSNIGGGIITFYLIGTGWLTVRRREGETSRLDWIALLIPLTVGILTWRSGLLRFAREPKNTHQQASFFCILHLFSLTCHTPSRRERAALLRSGIFPRLQAPGSALPAADVRPFLGKNIEKAAILQAAGVGNQGIGHGRVPFCWANLALSKEDVS